MSPKYWASSEDLSADSSAEGSQDESRDQSVHEDEDDGGDPEASELSTTEETSLQNSNAGTVARTTGTDIILPRLPNLQPHQHASLFYLSLIEGRCRTQAAHTVNAGRNPENNVPEDHPEVLGLAQHLFAEMQRELVKAGMIPEEFAGPALPDLRQYLNSFDTLLSNIATQRAFNLADQHSHRALRGFDSPFHSDIASNTSLFSYNSDPFVRRKSIMPPNSSQQLQRRPSPSKLSFFFPEVQDTTVNESIYTSNYVQLAELGKGGYGRVYKARYRMDGVEYAIKKITLKASYLRQLIMENKIHRVLNEIKVLARLDHHHIARYHHCWFETRQCSLPREDNDASNNNSEFSATGAQSNSVDAITSGIESIQFGMERDLSKQLKRERRATLTEDDEISRTSIVFGESRSTKHSDDSGKTKDQENPLKKSPKGMFYKPGSESDGTDDSNVEEIPRSEVGEASDVEVEVKINEDAILFIKMTPYPLTLEEFIWSDLQTTDNHARITHCFHDLPAVRILLAILEGVEYLHNKNIVHRDLKPKNIFLSILDPTEKPTQGYINIYKCAKCRHNNSTKPTFICPRIGDFGLIHELKHIDTEAVSGSGDAPFPFASSNAGTTLYCPPHQPKEKAIICPKLDVFSLGIIAFELVYHFTTDTERRVVLNKLGKSGDFPSDFAGHEMKEGIKNMVCKDRNQRWNTTLAREWLEGLVAKWE